MDRENKRNSLIKVCCYSKFKEFKLWKMNAVAKPPQCLKPNSKDDLSMLFTPQH